MKHFLIEKMRLGSDLLLLAKLPSGCLVHCLYVLF
jgi:hypothetical protein